MSPLSRSIHTLHHVSRLVSLFPAPRGPTALIHPSRSVLIVHLQSKPSSVDEVKSKLVRGSLVPRDTRS
jgi:hypothetical protein